MGLSRLNSPPCKQLHRIGANASNAPFCRKSCVRIIIHQYRLVPYRLQPLMSPYFPLIFAFSFTIRYSFPICQYPNILFFVVSSFSMGLTRESWVTIHVAVVRATLTRARSTKPYFNPITVTRNSNPNLYSNNYNLYELDYSDSSYELPGPG